jgi:hypothetical protein
MDKIIIPIIIHLKSWTTLGEFPHPILSEVAGILIATLKKTSRVPPMSAVSSESRNYPMGFSRYPLVI